MRSFFTTILVFALALPGTARAQAAAPSDADRITARALAKEGYEAHKRGQYAEAADRFRRAEALVHAPTLELGLARADVALHKLVEAHETYRRIVHEDLAPGAPAPFARAAADARRELAALEPRLAWVTVDVQGPPSSTVRVTIDDVAIPPAALGVKRASDPGEHHVRASAPGFAAVESTFVVAEGQTTSVALTPTPLPETATAPRTDLPPPDASRPPGVASSQATSPSDVPPVAAPPAIDSASRAAPSSSTPVGKTLGVLGIGLGAAGLVAGGVTGVLALAKHASLSGGCTDGRCSSSQSSGVSTYDTLATVSTVSFVAGAALAAAGFTLLLTAPKAAPVTAYVGPFSAGVTGRF